MAKRILHRASPFAVILRIGFGPKNVICLDNARITGPRETAARYHVKMCDSFVKRPQALGVSLNDIRSVVCVSDRLGPSFISHDSILSVSRIRTLFFFT